MLMPRPSKAVRRLISLIGCFLASEKVRCRYKMGALNVNVSISSEPAAYTWQEYKYRCENNQGTYFVTTSKFCTLCLGLRGRLNGFKMRWMHFSGKKQHTTTTGIPMSLRSLMHSSLCCFVTLTVRLDSRSTSSIVPVSLASSPSTLASSRRSNRFDSYKA